MFFFIIFDYNFLKNTSLNFKTSNFSISAKRNISLNLTTMNLNEIGNLMKPIPENDLEIKKFMIISASIESNDNYIFNLPMVCLSWRRIGIEPIVLIVKNSSLKINPLSNLTILYLNILKVKSVFIESPNKYIKMVSMVVRNFAGIILNISDSDFIMTSDSDLYPINKKYYEIANYNNESIYIWNAFCCGNFIHENESYQMYPMSSIAMSKLKWRKVMQINETSSEINGNLILKKIAQEFNKTLYIKKNDQIIKGDQVWYLDQTWISIKIKNYLKNNTISSLIRKHYTGLRLDRSMSEHEWEKSLAINFDSLTDCHSFQNNIFKNWKLLNLFLKLFSSSTNLWIQDYYLKFIKIIDSSKPN
jgi:hypothetical protein